MTGTRLRSVTATITLAVAAASLLLGFGGVAARAQVAIPPLPPQLEPVLSVVAPTVTPVCGDATLVLVALPALVALPVAIPPEVNQALAPVAIVCGAVPAVGGGYVCGLDAQAQALVDSITYQAAGTASPVAVQPGAVVTQQVATIEDTLGDADKEKAAAKAVAGVFQCTQPAGEQTPNVSVPPALGSSASPPAPAPVADRTNDAGSLPSQLGNAALAPVAPSPGLDATATTSAPQVAAARPIVVTRAGLPTAGLSIAIVVALLAGAALAVTVTRPITSRPRKES